MRSKHADTAHSVSILSVTNREAQKTIKADISSNNCTGWAKKQDCVRDQITLQRLTIERHVIRQKFQNFV